MEENKIELRSEEVQDIMSELAASYDSSEDEVSGMIGKLKVR